MEAPTRAMKRVIMTIDGGYMIDLAEVSRLEYVKNTIASKFALRVVTRGCLHSTDLMFETDDERQRVFSSLCRLINAQPIDLSGAE